MRYVAYYRVSTDRQGQSGLGLEAQRESVKRYLADKGDHSLVEFEEVESGTRRTRPVLAQALATARLHGATLIVAKVDRLTRNVAFLGDIMASGAQVVFLDLPGLNEGPISRYMLQNMASIAELEAGLISVRTKEALAAAKARGVKLGGNRGGMFNEQSRQASSQARTNKARQNARDTLMVATKTVGDIRTMSLQEAARRLNSAGVPTPSRKGLWQAVQVQRVLERAA